MSKKVLTGSKASLSINGQKVIWTAPQSGMYSIQGAKMMDVRQLPLVQLLSKLGIRSATAELANANVMTISGVMTVQAGDMMTLYNGDPKKSVVITNVGDKP